MTQFPLPVATAPQANEPLCYRAAMAAVWAPAIALLLGTFTQSLMKESFASTLVIGGTNCLLILIGFVSSIIALAGVFKYGPARLLLRGILGFLFGGGFIAAILIFIFVLQNLDSKFESRLTGNWKSTSLTPSAKNLYLHDDKNFNMTLSNARNSASVDGTWKVATQNNLHYLVLHINTATSVLAQKTGHDIHMQIQSADANQFTILDSNTPTTFSRVP